MPSLSATKHLRGMSVSCPKRCFLHTISLILVSAILLLPILPAAAQPSDSTTAELIRLKPNEKTSTSEKQAMVSKLAEVVRDKSERKEIRVMAVQRLREIKSEDAFFSYQEVAKDKSEGLSLRILCVRAIGDLKTSDTLRTLGEILLDEEDDDNLRVVSCIELGKIDDPAAVKEIIKASKSSKGLVRFKVADVLGRRPSQNTEDCLIRMLKDTNLFVRVIALESLGEIKSLKSIPAITLILRNPSEDPFVRLNGFCALKKIDATIFRNVAESLLDSLDPILQQEIEAMLESLNGN